MDLDEIDRLWEQHPAWRLVRARNAPLVLAFLGDHFIEHNRGATAAGELAAALDDLLYAVHRIEPDRFPAPPLGYLDDWSAQEAGWLRRFYPTGLDEVHYEATPALEKAYRWVTGLRARPFVGAESRLHILVDLLRQVVHGSETDPDTRIAELERRRDEIDEQLDQARQGRFAVLDDTARRERYQQFATTARELLSDFREVEENFRSLDRSARERIAAWSGGKGDLIADLVSSRTDIAASDQGRSFQAFTDFLLSEQRQQELTGLLRAMQRMQGDAADGRLRTVHHDWAEAAERTQQTVRNLSEQLRRFLEEQLWLENRRVLDLVRAVETAAIAVRDHPPGSDVGLQIDEVGIALSLPVERPLYSAAPEVAVESLLGPQERTGDDLDVLVRQRFVDRARLADRIRTVVPPRTTVDLAEILRLYPVEEGVAEILGYLTLGEEDDLDVELGDDETVLGYSGADGAEWLVRMPEVRVTRR